MTQTTYILLLEDDINLSTVLADYLRSKGYAVDTAMDGKEGWEMLSHKHYDILLTDIMMPRMNGLQVLKNLRESNNPIPVIIVSAKNDPKQMQKTGWTVIKAENVNAPVFTDFPMTLECRILRKIDETEEGYNIVAEIINILVDEAYIGEDGKPDVEKMQFITYEPIHHGYVELGKRVGNAFSDGKKLK